MKLNQEHKKTLLLRIKNTKMNDITSRLLLALSLLTLLSLSCYRDDDNSNSANTITSFTDGFFITNRGVDGAISGSISYYDRPRKEVANKIFEAKNDTRFDALVESITLDANRAYIVLHDEGQITIADPASMEELGHIPGFNLPRYFFPINSEKAYVSQWGVESGVGSIQVIDRNTNSISGEIATAFGPGRMVQQGNYIYVANSGGHFLDSVVTKIDVITDQVIKTIEVGLSPESLQFDKNGDLWVLGKGQESFSVNKPGNLIKIVNDELSLDITVPLGSRDLVINNSRDVLYFINGQSQRIYKHPIENTSISLAPFSVTPVTSLVIDPLTDLPIGADAKNFQVEGELLFFDGVGEVTKEFGLDYVPAEFSF